MRPASSIALRPLWLFFFLPLSEPAALPNSSSALRRFSCTLASVARREADFPTPSPLASFTSGPYSFLAAERASLRSSRNSLSLSARSRYGFSVSTVGATLNPSWPSRPSFPRAVGPMKYDDVRSSRMLPPDARTETHPPRAPRRRLRPRVRLGRGRARRTRRPTPEGGRETTRGSADGTLDTLRPAPPLRRARRLGRRLRRRRGGVVEALGSAHEPLHAAGHRHAAGGADPRGSTSGSGRPARSRSSSRATARRRRRSCRRRARRPPGRPRSSRPGGSSRCCRSSDSVVAAQIVSELDPADAKGRHGGDARGGGLDPGREAVPHGPGGDRARPRPGLRGGPEEGRALPRRPDRARDPHLHVRHACRSSCRSSSRS